jgi:hypothetical protein
MAGEFRPEAGFRISPIDPLGRTIEPSVLDAAEEIGQRAVHYAEKLVGDPALATNLLEESAALFLGCCEVNEHITASTFTTCALTCFGLSSGG